MGGELTTEKAKVEDKKMKGKIVAIIVIGVFVAAGFAGAAIAGRPLDAGPAEKATGCVVTGPRGWGIDFNAHEEKGVRDAKGQIYLWNNGREIEVDVEYVNIDGTWGYFAGISTYDSIAGTGTEGSWFYVTVHDDGTPGTNGDEIWWEWDTEDTVKNMVENKLKAANEKSILEGNIVVHTAKI